MARVSLGILFLYLNFAIYSYFKITLRHEDCLIG